MGVLTDRPLDLRALEAERHRPIPAARRVQLEILWHESPDWGHRRKALDQLTDNELFDFLERLADEAGRRAEGRLTIARLLARWDGEARSG
jgi:hypothetical protein